MRAHYLQHVPFEGLGSIKSWIDKAGYETTATKFHESTSLPDPREIDLLIILGGPMSVNDEEKYPWLRIEKQFIKNCIERKIPVLGICLGAQLIASALGEVIYLNRRKEIGWFPIKRIKQGASANFIFPEIIEVFHWHGETFDLPEKAHLLASSDACRNQAFQLGKNVIGLQFHLETTPKLVEALISNCRSDIQDSKYTQPEEAILDQPPQKYQRINSLMSELLNYLINQAHSQDVKNIGASP